MDPLAAEPSSEQADASEESSPRENVDAAGALPAIPDGASRPAVVSGAPAVRTGSGAYAAAVKTILVSDLVDSTRLVEQLGDEAATDLFALHDRMARDLLGDHGGREIDKSDGFLILFDRPLHAVLYARAYHLALAQLAREQGVALVSRVGIHVGEVMLHENRPQDVAQGAKPLEVEGLSKVVAARLMSLGRGGQTLLTRTAAEMAQRSAVGGEVPGGGLSWHSHGRYLFKGIAEPLEIFEVGDAKQTAFLSPAGNDKAQRVAAVSPEGLTPGKVRRRRWLAATAIAALLAVGSVAYYLRERSAPAGPDADGTTRDATTLLELRPSVSVVGFQNVSGAPEDAWLATAFTEMLSTEMAAGERLRIVSGETVSRMKTDLGLPDLSALASDTLGQVRRILGTDYIVTGSYLAVDGAAQRSIRLDFRLQDTASGEILASSSQIGSDADLFALVAQAGAYLRERLGIEALTASQAGEVRAAVSTEREAARLYSEGLAELRAYNPLAARDLLRRAVAVDPGYALAYAALSEAWTELGYDKEAVESAERAFELRQGLPREQILQIEGRYYRASAQRRQAIQAYQALWGFFPDNVDYGLKLAIVQMDAGEHRDALATAETLAALPEPLGNDPRIDLLAANVANYLADHQQMREAGERAARKGRELGSRTLLAQALRYQGIALRRLGEVEEATAALDRSQQLFAEIGDHGSMAQVLNSYGLLLGEQGSTAAAEEVFRRALAIHQQTGNQLWVATILDNLATLIQERGGLSQARAMLEESLAIVRKLDDRNRKISKLRGLGSVFFEQGELAAAEEKVLQALAEDEALGNRWGVAQDDFYLADIALEQGNVGAARERYERALTVSREIGQKHLTAQILTALGEALHRSGEPAAALERLTEAEALQTELGAKGSLALTWIAQAAVLLDLGRAADAEASARRAAAEVAREERLDDELFANALLIRSLVARSALDEAAGLVERFAPRARDSEQPRARFTFLLAAAEVEAARGNLTADRLLAPLQSEASSRGMVASELEIRLARARIALARNAEEARPELEALAQEAASRGFGRIAQQARALTASRTSSPVRTPT